MNAGSMEALIGANHNLKMVNTPMKVYKEAKLKGDTATMERAMGYVQDFEEEAKKYGNKALEETAKEAKEERKEQELKRKAAIEKRREDNKEFKEKLKKNDDTAVKNQDSVEISEDGRTAVENCMQENGSIAKPAETTDKTDTKPHSFTQGVVVDVKA